MRFDHDDERFLWIPFEKASVPKTGYEVIVRHWWITHSEKGLCCYRRPWADPGDRLCPQCNRVEDITRLIADRLFGEWAEPKLIEVAYVPDL